MANNYQQTNPKNTKQTNVSKDTFKTSQANKNSNVKGSQSYQQQKGSQGSDRTERE